MIFNITSDPSIEHNASCIVVPVFEIKNARNKQQFPTALEEINEASQQYITELVHSRDLTGKFGQCTMLFDLEGVTSERVMIIGCGNEKLDLADFKRLITKIYQTAENYNIQDLSLYLLNLCIINSSGEEASLEHKLKVAINAFNACGYSFNDYKKNKPSYHLNEVCFHIPENQDLYAVNKTLTQSIAIAEAANIVRDLANTPPNVCNPEYLAKYCVELTKEYSEIELAVLTQEEIIELGMGAFASVGRGSENKSRLISLSYNGVGNNQSPIVFVGKGITFDTGGNSLKPPLSMIGMKYDMSGAATVIGLLKFAAQAQLPLNIIGIIAAAENMPGASSSRPDDIVTSMSGQTIEILNTDAEGRLVLCDALTYSERFSPEVVIDIATLTGACLISLGDQYAGLFSNTQALADDLLKAGIAIDDKCWQLPMNKEYHELLKSNVADFTNVGGPEAGSITAACFLAKFASKFKWAHLDVAGVAAKYSGKERGPSGRPLYVLAEYLLSKV